MSMYGIFNLVVFAALLSFLFQLAKKELGLSRRVLIGLMLGSILASISSWSSVIPPKPPPRHWSGRMLSPTFMSTCCA